MTDPREREKQQPRRNYVATEGGMEAAYKKRPPANEDRPASGFILMVSVVAESFFICPFTM